MTAKYRKEILCPKCGEKTVVWSNEAEPKCATGKEKYMLVVHEGRIGVVRCPRKGE